MAQAPPNRQPRATIAIREKENRALEMVKAGATMAMIASVLGYANESGAWKAVQRALARIPKAQADELREIKAQALADLTRHTMSILARSHPVLYKGRPVIVDGKVVDDDMVKLRAIEVLIKAEESHRRLLGLDLPRKVEISGEDGGPIPIELRVGQLRERLLSAQSRVIEATSTDTTSE